MNNHNLQQKIRFRKINVKINKLTDLLIFFDSLPVSALKKIVGV